MINKNILAKHVIYMAVISLVCGCTTGPKEAEVAVVQQNAEPNLRLNAIYWSPPMNSLVVIDGEEYRVGDKVNGYTIVEIRKTEIVLSTPKGKELVLYFYDQLKE